MGLPAMENGWKFGEIGSLVRKMREAYEQVHDYQTEVTVHIFEEGTAQVKQFLYTFRKPNQIRIVFRTPHRGMTLVYPDEADKVVVRLGGWLGFATLRLDPNNRLLRSAAGQRIDQTDLGLLIDHIEKSLTEGRKEPPRLEVDDRYIEAAVLAEDHFLDNVLTRYRFFIDRENDLPARIEESTPEGVLRRRIEFHGMRINIGISEDFFHPG
jgi:hypothetical protein